MNTGASGGQSAGASPSPTSPSEASGSPSPGERIAKAVISGAGFLAGAEVVVRLVMAGKMDSGDALIFAASLALPAAVTDRVIGLFRKPKGE